MPSKAAGTYTWKQWKAGSPREVPRYSVSEEDSERQDCRSMKAVRSIDFLPKQWVAGRVLNTHASSSSLFPSLSS